VHSYNKDGSMRYEHNGAQPVYAPNSHGGPVADPALGESAWFQEGGEIMRSAYTLRRDDDDFSQPGALYRAVMSETDREHLVTNIVGHLSDGVADDTLNRAIQYWSSVDSDLGVRVRAGLAAGNGGAPSAASAASPSAAS
jgi:catalase